MNDERYSFDYLASGISRFELPYNFSIFLYKYLKNIECDEIEFPLFMKDFMVCHGLDDDGYLKYNFIYNYIKTYLTINYSADTYYISLKCDDKILDNRIEVCNFYF
jgi:hypothetical protein